MKYLYGKNFKFLKKEIKEECRRWKDLPCSWIGKINIVKMAILPKAIYTFNAISIKFPTQFFTDLKRIIVSFRWKDNKPRVIKTILKNKGTYFSELLESHSDRKLWYLYIDRQVDQWNRIEVPEINPYRHLIYDKEAKLIDWK